MRNEKISGGFVKAKMTKLRDYKNSEGERREN